MPYWYRPIVNSDLIGERITIQLPGFPGGKAEKCLIHYITLGEGEPLLLVHSLGQSLYTWRDLIPLLAEKYNVIALDLVGHGFSGRPVSMNYSMDEMADTLVEFVKVLKLDHVHAVGASMGGMYLLRAMTRFPEMFDKVTVLCPGGITKQMPRKIRRMATPFIGPFVREGYTKKDVKNALQLCYYDSRTSCVRPLGRGRSGAALREFRESPAGVEEGRFFLCAERRALFPGGESGRSVGYDR